MKTSGRVWTFALSLAVLSGPAPRGDLQAQAAGPGFLDLDGDRVFHEVTGRGEALVLLHDGLTHGGIWDDAFRRLSGSFRVVRYDRRGHGRSDVPTAPHSPVEDLRALLDHLDVERAVLVGSSAGGRLALDFAVRFPDRASALVLVGPVVSGYGYSEHFVERGRRNMGPLSDGDVEATLSNWVEDRYLISADGDDARKRLRGLMEPYAEKRFLAYDPDLARGPEAPALPRLEALDVPALVVVGAEDVPDVHAHAGAIDSRLPASRRVVVPGAGHLVAFERPRAFLRLVLDFLRSR